MFRSFYFWLFIGLPALSWGQFQDFNDLCDLSESEAKAASMQRFNPELNKNPLADNYDLNYHRLELVLDPNVAFIQGKVTSYFTTLEDNFSAVHFDVSDSLTVRKAWYHGVSLPFAQIGGDVLRVTLPDPLPKGSLDSLTVEYDGQPSEGEGFGSFIQSSHAGEPIIWTLSEPYGAKDWWVCKQNLNDKIDSLDVWVLTPKPYTVASNGLLIKEVARGDSTFFHWKHRYPIETYLVAVAVTNYTHFSDFTTLQSGVSLPILNFVYPEDSARYRNDARLMIDLIPYYENLFEKYPFEKEKYGHAQFGWGGGMEHQTMSFMTNFNYELQAHELLHQWFGNKITCGSWSDIWLNEGFATYFTGVSFEHFFDGRYWQAWKENMMQNARTRPEYAVFVDDTTDVSRIFNGYSTYAKGAMVLHGLRWQLGDEDFFQALRNYLQDPNLAFGYARTADLKRHLEEQSGQDLTEFFQDWFYGKGFPNYEIVWEVVEERQVRLKVSQTSEVPLSVAFFEAKLPLRFKSGNQVQDVVVQHDFSGQIFDLTLDFTPDSLFFDPDIWLLKGVVQLYPTFSWEQTVKISPNPASDFLKIQSISEEALFQKLSFYNTFGQLINEFNLNHERSINLPVRQLAAGVYVLKIETTAGTVTKKIVLAPF